MAKKNGAKEAVKVTAETEASKMEELLKSVKQLSDAVKILNGGVQTLFKVVGGTTELDQASANIQRMELHLQVQAGVKAGQIRPKTDPSGPDDLMIGTETMESGLQTRFQLKPTAVDEKIRHMYLGRIPNDTFTVDTENGKIATHVLEVYEFTPPIIPVGLAQTAELVKA